MPKSSSRKSRPVKAIARQGRAAQPGTAASNVAQLVAARRAAYAQPRILVTTMLLMLIASVLWAVAQNKKANLQKTTAKPAPTSLVSPGAKSKRGHVLTPKDIPSIVKAYGEQQRFAAKAGGAKGSGGKVGTRRFNLTEKDLTPFNPSDERQPSFSPGNNLIAFVSNGADTNNDGRIDSLGSPDPVTKAPHFHLWVMNRDGSQQRQITGLQTGTLANGAPDPTKDGNRDQFTPSWSPDGNTLAYTDTGALDSQLTVNPDVTVKTEVFTVTNITTPSATPTATRITFSGGTKLRPVFDPAGTAIAFASTVFPQRRSGTSADDPAGANDARGQFFTLANAAHPNNNYDIFTIDPTGTESSVRRLTGGPNDTMGGADADDVNPAYSQVGVGQFIYFSSNRTMTTTKNANGTTTTTYTVIPEPARRIWRIRNSGAAGSNIPQQVSDPTARTERIDNNTNGTTIVGQATDTDDYPSPSLAFGAGQRIAFHSNSKIDASDMIQDFNVWSLQITGTPPFEQSGNSAFVESNVTSSPNAATNTQIEGVTEDKADDREPSFSQSSTFVRQNNTFATTANIVAFSSDRANAAAPGTINPVPGTTPVPTVSPTGTPGPTPAATVTPAATPTLPAGSPTPTPGAAATPIVVNPTPGAFNATSPGNTIFDPTAPGGSGHHDIWTTISEDFTPPILLSQSVGNQEFPVLAPGPQASSAGLTAPRTEEAGLEPGTPVTIAFTVQDLESTLPETVATAPGSKLPAGLADIRIDFYNAETDGYNFTASPFGGVFQKPATLGTNPQDVNESILVNTSYQIKSTQVGSIDFANNPAGFIITDSGPLGRNGGQERQAGAVAGDGTYYVQTSFTTPTTARDYYFDITLTDKAGNTFTYDNIWGFSTRRFTPSSATASDLFVSDYTAGQRFPGRSGDARFGGQDPIESYYLNNPADPAFANTTTVNTLGNLVDTWRTLSRGAVPSTVINIYNATTVQQIDPSGTNDPTFTKLTRNVAVARRAIFWASPYTGEVVAGPGTLADAAVQTQLSSFLSLGGRLCVTGRDVAFALTNGGATTNNFLQDELQASFTGGEGFSNNITAAAGKFSSILNLDGANPADSDSPQLPPRDTFQPNDINFTDQYTDASVNQGFSNGIDFLGQGSSPSSVRVAYTLNGNTVGQRVERTRSSGVNSRVAFLSFGLEGVNRRYDNTNGAHCVDVRRSIASGIREFYLKTGGVTGQVVNANTNQPVPGFLVEVDGTNGPYYARTDSNGNYTVLGIPLEGFSNAFGAETFSTGSVKSSTQTVQPNVRFVQNNGFGFGLFGAGTQAVPTLRVVPLATGSLSGTVTQSNGTISGPTARSDDTPLPNVPVLVKSIDTSPDFPNGGKFAALAQTDAFGNFSFSQVPPNIKLQVVFNPKPGFESAGGDIPDNSGLSFNNGGTFNNNPNVGRRLIPDSARSSDIVVPSGNTFILNDTDLNNDGISDPGLVDDPGQVNSNQPILVPVGPTITGKVFLNNTTQPASGATVTLFRQDSATALTPFRTTTTIADGSFSFPDVPPMINGQMQTYSVQASLTNGGIVIRSQLETLPPFKGLTDLTAPADFPFLIISRQNVSGTVSFNGSPIAGATVELKGSNGVPVTTTTPTTTSATDLGTPASAGRYAFFNVAVGTYTITVTLPNGLTEMHSLTVTAGNDNNETNDAKEVDFSLFAVTVSGNVTFTNGNNPSGPPPIPPDATVTLIGKQFDGIAVNKTTQTDATGNYSFALVRPGSYTLTATITFTFNGTQVSDTVQEDISVGATASANIIAQKLTLFLESISGHVNLNQNPASAGITVNLFQGTTVRGTLLQTTTTNANGDYSFNNLGAGTYTVQVVSNSSNGDKMTATVTLRRGDGNRTVDFTLTTEAISGTVRLNGMPTANATVTLLQDGTVIRTATPAANGSFSFSGLQGVVPGQYTLRASGSGDTTPDVPITVGAGRDNTRIILDLFLETIMGKVTLNGMAIGGATVQLIQNGGVLATTTTASDGSYNFPNLLPGAYTLTGSFGGDVATVTVAFARPKTVAGVIIMAPTIALFLEAISGRVTLNGVPFGGATVSLIDASGKVLATTTSAASGLYQFLNKPVGNYTLQATATAAQLGAIGAGAGDTVQVAVSVTRGPNAAIPGDLALVTESITGRVTVDGQPTGAATVELLQNGTVLKTVTTNSNGTYTFSRLLPGTYVIQASQGGDVVQIAVTVARGDNVTPPTVPDIKLFLETITGKVALNNKLIKGAIVLLIKGTFKVARATTDATGSYSFTGLLPGTYRVRALFGGDQADIIARVTRGKNASNPTIRLFLETVTGRVTLNGKPVSGAQVMLTLGNRGFGVVTTTSSGTYSYANLAAGAYTITATKLGVTATTRVTVVRAKNLAVPDLDLKIESVSGQVLLNGKPLGSGTVFLLNGDESLFGRVTTDGNGHYSFTKVPDGTYIVRVTASGITQDVNITVRAGVSLTVPTIKLVTATPTPVATPMPTPVPTGANTYAMGQTYQITIPYMDSAAADATTTPAKAFNLPPLQNGTQNYRIFRYNAQTEKYEELGNTSPLRRGEGYFLRPESNDVSLSDPASDHTRKPTSVTSFTVVLRNNPSLSSRDPHNGFNLIGSPFNPAAYAGADFLNSQVVTPDGHVYPTVSAAVAGGVLSPNLFTFDETSGDYKVVNGTLNNFQGYYVRTFVNGVKLVLKPSR